MQNKEEIMKELSKKIAEGWAYHDYMMLDSTTLLKETVPDPIERVRKSYGAPLSPELRKKFEPIMGFKMDDVKIHTDKVSQNTAKNLNAEAFTYGKDIYFAQDKYNPETTSGKSLIGHELTHIAQQKGKVGELAMKGFSPTQNLEKQAENMEKYLTEVFARSKSNEPLIKIDNIEIKAQDKEQEDDIRFLRIKTMIESLIEPYIYKELANNPELLHSIRFHNVEIEEIIGENVLVRNTDSENLVASRIAYSIAQKVMEKVKNKMTSFKTKNINLIPNTIFKKKTGRKYYMSKRYYVEVSKGIKLYREEKFGEAAVVWMTLAKNKKIPKNEKRKLFKYLSRTAYKANQLGKIDRLDSSKYKSLSDKIHDFLEKQNASRFLKSPRMKEEAMIYYKKGVRFYHEAVSPEIPQDMSQVTKVYLIIKIYEKALNNFEEAGMIDSKHPGIKSAIARCKYRIRISTKWFNEEFKKSTKYYGDVTKEYFKNNLEWIEMNYFGDKFKDIE